MTPPPPATPDDSALPPRHRPNMGSLAKDTTEGDLWDFDEPGNSPERIAPEPIRARPIPMKRGPEAPKGRNISQPEASAAPVGEPPGLAELLPPRSLPPQDSVKVNVGKSRPRPPAAPLGALPNAEADFDELQQWEDAEAVAEILQPDREIEQPPAAESASETAEPPPPAPARALPRMNLSGVEKLGLLALLVLLLAGGGFAFFATIHRLPTEKLGAAENDFPIKGKILTVASAKSYWRAPVETGPDADTFRRGTLLLPAVKLAVRGGPAAVRVFFRDSSGAYVGDAANRSVGAGGGEFEVAATAGFEDIGMHAAYRAGQTKPWIAEVFEAPTANSPPEAFKKLFVMEISPDRH